MKNKKKYNKLLRAINELWFSCIISDNEKIELKKKLRKEYEDYKF